MRAEPAVRGADEVTELAADQPGVAQGVLADHQLVPDEQVLGAAHLDQLQSFDLLEALGHGAGGGDALVQAGGGAGPRPRADECRRRQRPLTLRFEIAEGFGGAGDLPVAFGVAQLEALAELSGESGARRRRIGGEQATHEGNIVGLARSFLMGKVGTGAFIPCVVI